METEQSLPRGAAPALDVRAEGADRSLRPGPSYTVGRDPGADIVLTDSRVSWEHAVLRLDEGDWVLEDRGSTNGTYLGSQRLTRVSIGSGCVVRLGHPADGPALRCTVGTQDGQQPPGQRAGAV
ncbi:MAG: FHA domain-containing protein, partial [Actinobacteria bacterium]|nr:FHA domain-containing protein [Actinomycetota bacterium]